MDLHKKALDSIFGDLDDMEQKKMFPEPDGDEGTSITITVSPCGVKVGGENPGMEDPDHEEAMCKGGCAYHSGGIVKEPAKNEVDMHGNPDPEYKQGEEGFAQGGMVPPPEMPDENILPPFLRKKKK